MGSHYEFPPMDVPRTLEKVTVDPNSKIRVLNLKINVFIAIIIYTSPGMQKVKYEVLTRNF